MTFATAALAAMQGIAKYAEGRQQANAYTAQAAQAEANARIAERNRGAAADEAAVEQRRARERYALTEGQNAAQLGGGELDVNSGLGAALGRANARAFNTDYNQINENLGWRDTDLRQQIANEEANAQNYKYAAKNAKRMALINGVLATAQGLYGSKISKTKATEATPGSISTALAPATPVNSTLYRSSTYRAKKREAMSGYGIL